MLSIITRFCIRCDNHGNCKGITQVIFGTMGPAKEIPYLATGVTYGLAVFCEHLWILSWTWAVLLTTVPTGMEMEIFVEISVSITALSFWQLRVKPGTEFSSMWHRRHYVWGVLTTLYKASMKSTVIERQDFCDVSLDGSVQHHGVIPVGVVG